MDKKQRSSCNRIRLSALYEQESIFQNAARVEAEVTASRSYGRGCTEINHSNATTIDSGATTTNSTMDSTTRAVKLIHTNNAVNSNDADRKSHNSNDTDQNSHNTPKRGFQHVYTSTKTRSSLRVHAAHNATVKNSAARTKNAMKRNARKSNKLNDLRNVIPSPTHSLPRDSLKSKPVFFSGTSERIVPNPPPNSVVLSAIEDLTVVDTVDGARMVLDNEDVVFILVPRNDSIREMTRVNETLRALHAVDAAKTHAEIRGKTRIPVAENHGKYTTVGLKPDRGHTGIIESWPNKLNNVDKRKIVNLMTRCEEVAKGYLRSDDLRGIERAKLLGNWRNITKGASQPDIWGSLAIALNYYLNSHTDEDFFYSLLTITSAYGLQEDIDRYSLNADVCNYFTFAEQGIAVALRPGDMLLFNPVYQHCLSSRTSLYENKDVFSLSLYLKTAIVGKKDNNLPLTESDMHSLKK